MHFVLVCVLNREVKIHFSPLSLSLGKSNGTSITPQEIKYIYKRGSMFATLPFIKTSWNRVFFFTADVWTRHSRKCTGVIHPSNSAIVKVIHYTRAFPAVTSHVTAEKIELMV